MRPAAPHPHPDAAPPSRVLARLKRWLRPVPAASADGPFTDAAHDRDPLLWASMHRVAVLAGVAAAMGGAVAGGRLLRR